MDIRFNRIEKEMTTIVQYNKTRKSYRQIPTIGTVKGKNPNDITAKILIHLGKKHQIPRKVKISEDENVKVAASRILLSRFKTSEPNIKERGLTNM
jgi:hypothetical protein